MTRYTVNQGDHLTSIADSFGFRDYAVIWNHPENAGVKELRGDPNVIAPGDELVIPDPQTKEESCATEKLHRFRVHTRQLKLRLRLLDVNDEPLSDLPCTLCVENNTYETKSDADGYVETVIPPSAELGWIRASDASRGVALDERFAIGHLDPIEMMTGVATRLSHLGYDVGEDLDAPDADLLLLAIEEFQCDNDLDVTGEADDPTRARLLELHGA